MTRKLQRIAALLFLPSATLCAGEKRVQLFPKLQSGQTITYLIRFQTEKTVKTESRVVAPMAPNDPPVDAHGLLRVEILDVQGTGGKAAIHARGQFPTLDSGVWLKGPRDKKTNGNKQPIDPAGKSIEFTVLPDGTVNVINGLDTLFPEQQQAWQQWVARFALAWTLPADGMKPGEKWKSEQAEHAEAPITGLVWERESSYVRDEPCQATQLSITGDISSSSGPAETCAVLLTAAKLKQKSSSKDATPEAFRLHDLRTMGTAKGANETITYISLKTGLVVRATEETTQFMDVVVVTADGSNHVHYNVDAKSISEVLLVVGTPLVNR